MRTSFPQENGDVLETRKDFANKTADSESKPVKFPKAIKHRGRTVAKVYGKSKSYSRYRLYYRAAGRSVMRHFSTYAEALTEGERLKSELYSGKAAVLTGPQTRDALAALERLQGFYQSSGRRVSLLGAVSEFAEAAGKLNGRTLGDAVEGYLTTVANVKRKDIAAAVEEFITAEHPRTKSSDGARAQLSPKYAYNRAIMLRRFAASFPNNAVCDLAKEHLDVFIGGLAEMQSRSRNKRRVKSAKGRNHHRAAIRQFLAWAVRKDYLLVTHRLGEADAMRPEHANNGEIGFYTPAEFKALLDVAEGPMLAMIAIGGLAGLRTQELLRLDWEDLWRVKEHIEVTAGKSKTRQRRLVEIRPSLARWLQPFRAFKGGNLWDLREVTWQQHFVKLCERARVERKSNGLRHAFCSYAYALKG